MFMRWASTCSISIPMPVHYAIVVVFPVMIIDEPDDSEAQANGAIIIK